MNAIEIVVSYVQTRHGVWHKQLTVDGELMSNEEDNLDQARIKAFSNEPPPEGAKRCRRCFKGLT